MECREVLGCSRRGSDSIPQERSRLHGSGNPHSRPLSRRGRLRLDKGSRDGEPIATGTAIVDGEEMMSMTKGKAISTVHWVGDDLWNLED